MGKYQTVKRGGRNRAVCEGCKVTVNRLMAYRTDTLAKACRDCATSEEMYGVPYKTPASWGGWDGFPVRPWGGINR